MGCGTASSNQGISIENNLVALIVSGQSDLAIIKMTQMGDAFDPNASINFRGDTVLHYACKKNDLKLVTFLLKNPKTLKSSRNMAEKLPKDLTTVKEIQRLCS